MVSIEVPIHKYFLHAPKLQPTGCIGAFCTDDSELTVQVIGPQTYAEECLDILDGCPAVVDVTEHVKWLEEAETSLLPLLNFLEGFDAASLQRRNR